jgi:multiple sugar transport system permease protein
MIAGRTNVRKGSYKATISGRARNAAVLRWTVLAFFAIYVIAPFVWMVSISLKPETEVFAREIAILPREPTLANYEAVFIAAPYLRYFMNSLLVAIVTTLGAVTVSTLAAYAFSRFRFRGRDLIAFLILATQMFPLVTGIIPLYLIFSKLGLINTYWCLFIAYVAFTIPFCTWMLKGFFDTIPKEIEEAALIDGCTRMQVLRTIVLPMSGPALVATGVFCFILSWNEFLYATVLTTSDTVRTLPAALGQMIGQGYTQWGALNAAGIMTTLPVVLFFMLFQRYLVSGLTAGAMKG